MCSVLQSQLVSHIVASFTFPNDSCKDMFKDDNVKHNRFQDIILVAARTLAVAITAAMYVAAHLSRDPGLLDRSL